jgi:peptidoglycan/xylan/chitin deacetylase (PgdA/CDA1 family)
MSKHGFFSEREPSSDRTSGATLFRSSSTASAARVPFGATETDSSESRTLGDRQGLQPIHRHVAELMQHWAEPPPNATQANASALAPMASVQAVKEFGKLGSSSHGGGGQDSKLGQAAPGGQAGGTLGSAHAGGDVKSRKMVRVAWTFDDGPTSATPAMRKLSAQMPSTWYVMRSQIDGGAQGTQLTELRNLQEQGHEIAIHSSHPTLGHISWFPSDQQASYDSIDQALSDLKSFHGILLGAGIKTKFVRLPYGEHTELVQYLQKLKVPKPDSAARNILNGTDVSQDPHVARVAGDYQKLQAALSSLGLHLWGGSGAGRAEMATMNSWEAESSGNANREDNVTTSVSPARRKKQQGQGKFEHIVDMTAQDGKLRSLVVLAHDTSKPDVFAVQDDIQQMNSYALSKHVRVEYETMSELYKNVRGQEP